MRLSDILKKTANHTQPAQVPVKPSSKPEIKPDQNKTPHPAVQPSSITKIPVLLPETSYTNAVSEIKSIIEHADKDAQFVDKIQSVQEILELIEDGNDDITMLADKATPDLYLYSHSVNVCIFASMLGKHTGYSDYGLRELGFCSFLHDIGMVKNLNIAQKKGKLTASEYNLIKKHPPTGQDLLKTLGNIPAEIKEMVSEVILQIHERINGGGYPGGLKGKTIHPLARIIAIADVYEALTHPRPYRDRMIPHEAIKYMISCADSDFDADLLKSFLDRISLYPPGSYVKLNTEEIARVIKLNPGLPTRPTVRAIVSEKGHKITENKIIDLSASPVLFIKEAVDETKLSLPDKRLALELKAVRWWVKSI